jgi:hypothetical protein
MTDEQLRSAYRQAVLDQERPADPVGPGRRECPDLEALLAVVQQEGPEEQRIATLDHALACAACRRELEVLRTVDEASRASVAEAQGAGTRGTEVRSLGEARERRAGRPALWRRAVPLALAASLALAVGLGVTRRVWDRESPEPMREAQPGGESIALAAPGDGDAVALPATLVWHAVPRARWYVAELVTEDGAVAFSARTTDTSLTAPAAPNVGPGEYRWTVRAQLDNGAERRSTARRLRIRAP